MRRSHMLTVAVVFATGYVIGAYSHGEGIPVARAQSTTVGYDKETLTSFQAMHKALNDTANFLTGESKYSSAIEGPNAFAISVGGVDAVRDLEENRGVDPETFAALYAGRASPDVFPNIGTDEDGRLTYKGNVIKMYSRERLKKLYTRRDELLRAR